jgi:cytochrome c biogenesis protein CcdA
MFMSKNLSIAAEIPAFLRRIGLPVMVASLALIGAFVAAKLIGKDDGIDGVNGFVESLSGGSSSFLGNLGLLAPLGFAFAAGMASAVNPCGFAMLPAYLGLYLGSNQEAQPTRQFGRALLVGLSVTAGFVVLFGTVGVIIAIGARSAVVGVLPWLGLGIGIILAVTGAWMVGGGKLYSGLAARAASRIGDPSQVSPKGYFLFGLSYGTASLGCTLPIFLTVVGTSLAVSDLGASFGQFLLYALGMGLVIMALTLGLAVAKGAMVGAVRKALPYVQPVGAWLMVIAGAYIVFYWLTLGGLF